jgi:hypothetical protein
MGEWMTFRLPKELNQELESYVKTNEAKTMGILNKTQLLIKISRDFLQNPDYSKKIQYLESQLKMVDMLKNKINDMEQQLSQIKERSLDDEAQKIRNDNATLERQRQMQKQIDKLQAKNK